jgi:Serine/threonine protein phosphatase
MSHAVLCILILINIPLSSIATRHQETYGLSPFLLKKRKQRGHYGQQLQSRQSSSSAIKDACCLYWKDIRGGGSNGEVSDSEQYYQSRDDIIFNPTPLDDESSLFITSSTDSEWLNVHHQSSASSLSTSSSDNQSYSSFTTFPNNSGASCENRIYPVSICSVQGRRQYMEDEYFTNSNGSFCSVMDGHGGNAVSKYLRQNLYARYLQAKATTTKLPWGGMSSMKDNDEGVEKSEMSTREQREKEKMEDMDGSIQLDENSNRLETKNMGLQNNNDSKGTSWNGSTSPATTSFGTHDESDHVNLHTCILALKAAFEKIDAEVQKISHWSYQGSTAVAVKLHKMASSNNTVFISANVGDSRAVLCRAGRAIELTKDHKPNDPEERRRIEGLGGKVEWFGRVDDKGLPLERDRARGGFSGVYRINRNLSLSRAIGDRSELPYVCSTVDISCIDLDQERDSFIILATDGLWDVFDSSQEVINVCQQIMDKTFRKTALMQHQHAQNKMSSERLEKTRNKVSKQLVREALKRGSLDNITVIIIWL